ncbi:YbjN domain-containing protein [Sphingobium sp. H39-3-25]|uniref:YbjN domain-containing protein n=1 Tax=Sphingobium arseniciresistens TaxID=3030834 RepID=UPI0023B9C468|nr:YbjN domain-containing protein [Sphingobium arseniciresistens]
MIGKTILAAGLGMLALAASSSAHAADKEKCGAGLVCASDPKTIVDALMAAGYKAKLGKDSQGDPQIESAASGYNYTIYFYDCEENKNCAAIQFQVSFSDDGKNTFELANKWNRSKRFMQMAVQEDKGLRVCYDLTTVGGLNQKNFADVTDWWAVMLNELNLFFKEQG